jgi:putative intracellular protease/amidase
MKFAVLISPKDFSDETISMIKLLFDRWNVGYDIASYTKGECVGNHGAIYRPDINAGKISTQNYDGIILVDGEGINSYKLHEFRPLLDLLSLFDEKKKRICAINNAIKIIAKANIIKGKRISTPRDEETVRLVTLFHGLPSENQIEMADNLITIKDHRNLEESMGSFLDYIKAR